MKLAWNSGWILAVVAVGTACVPEKLELGDAPLQTVGGSSAAAGGSSGGTGGGTNNAACVSPTEHPERGFDEGVTFCACEGDDAQCVDTEGDGYIGFICEDGTWAAVNDGPCGLEQGKCYSPTQNAEHALDAGAVGCACEGDEAQCVTTVEHGMVGFICENGAWAAVNDGPCGLEQRKCYSPTQNAERALDEGAIGCACEGDEAQCVELPNESLLGFICAEDGTWHAVNDGPCGAEP